MLSKQKKKSVMPAPWTFTGLALLLCASSVQGATLRVPASYASIQAAINACGLGDTVLVSSGTYFERLVIPRRLVLKSESGASQTTIDAETKGIAILVSILGQGTVIDGFRIKNGYADSGSHAAGIHCEVVIGAGGAVVIRNNIVEYNHSLAYVGGVYALRASTIENNIIQHNNEAAAKATSALWAAGIVRGNVIRYNGDLGELLTVQLQGVSLVENNLIVDNHYATEVIIIDAASGGIIRNNTIANNGCGLWALGVSGNSIDVRNNIVTHGSCAGLVCELSGASMIRCNNVWGGPGEHFDGDCANAGGINGNFSLDPLFCNPPAGDYHLQAASPCAPNNAPAGCGLIGAMPVCAANGIDEGIPAAPAFEVRVEPNPARGPVEFVTSSEGGNSTIEIYSANGRLVDIAYGVGSRIRWDRGAESPRGVYMARVTRLGAARTVKFVLVE